MYIILYIEVDFRFDCNVLLYGIKGQTIITDFTNKHDLDTQKWLTLYPITGYPDFPDLSSLAHQGEFTTVNLVWNSF